jgi:predicted trehalose synthase
MPLQHRWHLEKRLDELAKRLRQQARGVPPGVEREELLRRAQAAETASNINHWFNSRELAPPNREL